MRQPLEKVFKEAKSWFNWRSPHVALAVIEDARFLSANDGRRLRAIDHYLDTTFDADLLRQVHDKVDRELGTISRWIKESSFGDDLWWITIMNLRNAYALAIHEKRRFKVEEAPLLTEAFAGLSEASRDFRDPLYLKYLGKAGPLLTARIEAQRRVASDGDPGGIDPNAVG